MICQLPLSLENRKNLVDHIAAIELERKNLVVDDPEKAVTDVLAAIELDRKRFGIVKVGFNSTS